MTINKFSGRHAFLSNFYASPIIIEEMVWPTSEHLYQACKTYDIHDQDEIMKAATPGKAKRLGRAVTIREDWEVIKEKMMLEIVRLKFKQNANLAKRLIATRNQALVEGNYWHDNEWGDCSCSTCCSITGKNLLGKILMQVREELKT